MKIPTMRDQSNQIPRLSAIDFARGVALIAMAVFHFAWDLENFGFAHRGLTLEPQWKYFARTIAASFLFMVGFSSWLAHSRGIDWRSFGWRMAKVGSAAALITFATYFATPQAFIFFGILHNIALSSLLILLFFRFHAIILMGIALVIFSAPYWARTETLDLAIWWWSGLSQITPKANDYVPIFPWFGWVVLGLSLAKIFDAKQIWCKIAYFKFENPPGRLLQFFGRHSLIFYLVHQPIMIGLIYLYAKFIAGT